MFKTKTNNTDKKLDCIDIFKHKDDPSNYYGVFHEMDADTQDLHMYLAKSNDGLKDWQQIVKL